ncbi:hypothetical protein PF007_g8549 [Phytophthora fragariae]|uniref:Uncharacterized protein n=1 Tax=Phytophthora fragariae TaxID=53985 RepID=A0A6A3SSE2_9STRA|nr:hypothetical protein PF007_g8549 [Phytophthora fragariae]
MIDAVKNPATKKSVLFVDLDHKQKVLGRKLVENQIEYFGKVGMSLLGAMILSAPSAGTAASASSSAQSPTTSVVAETPESRRSLQPNDQSAEVSATRSNVAGSAKSEYGPESGDHNGAESPTGADGVGVSLHFVDMIVNNGTHDLFQVISCMEALIIHLHEAFPEATRLVPGSDNASVFASGEWMPWVIKLTRKHPHLRVSRYMNTEAQTGRDMLDAHFSFLNRKANAFVRKDNVVQTPAELFAALTDDGGVANTTTLLVSVDLEKAEHFNNAKQNFSSKIRNDKLTGVEVLRKITSLKEARLRKSLSEALASERRQRMAPVPSRSFARSQATNPHSDDEDGIPTGTKLKPTTASTSEAVHRAAGARGRVGPLSGATTVSALHVDLRHTACEHRLNEQSS